MKKLFFPFFIAIMIVSFSLHAQVKYEIYENSYQKINISFSFGEITNIDVITAAGTFSRIFMEGCSGSKNLGKPELPVVIRVLETPIFEDYVLNVYGKDSVVCDAKTLGISHPIYPAQPSVSKSHEGPVAFVQNNETYQTDGFYAMPLAQFEKTGMMRNINLGQLYLSPVQYNPVTQEIKIYKSIDVEILFKKVDLTKTQTIRDLHQSPLFRPSNVINPMKNDKAEFSSSPIKYLMVAHASFRGELDELIAWKKRKGFMVEVGYTDDERVGASRDSIFGFIQSFYENATPKDPAPTFVLLVGDVQQIPVFYGFPGSHPTDLYYFTREDGNIPFCYYGRFSAQTIEQLIPQIKKTLQYEQFSMPDPKYLDNIVLIAGHDDDNSPVYANGFVNYITQYYATTEYGYSNISSFLHPCSDEEVQIRNKISTGVGIANYSAHCSPFGWVSPSFNTNHIAAMNNENKYGLMIGNCCESNRFSVNECFGEALLRAPKKGAVGYIGAANLTYWDEDYFWGIGLRTPCTFNPTYEPANLGAYDRLFHTHGETHDKWMTTFGSMIVAGNEAVNSSTSSLKKYYWEIYNLMGDPSLATYLTQPTPMNVVVTNRLDVGATSLNAKVAPHSYCALTNSKSVLVCAGFADADGNIVLHFDNLSDGKYEFAVWAQNHIQFFKTIHCGENSINEDTLSFSIFPNPTTGELRITNYELRITNVEVFDVYGKKQSILQSLNPSIPQSFNISHFNPGIYFLKIQTDKTTYIQKIIKQ